MDENYCNRQTFASIVKTILLFLENNNLNETAGVFSNEIAKKLKNVRMDDVAPRTVILRPMDIKTNVDATISDENLIICISDVNGSGFDKTRDTASIRTESPHCFDAELLENTQNLLDNHEDEILDKDVSKDDLELSNHNVSTNTPEKDHEASVPEVDLQNVADEKVEYDVEDSPDQYDNNQDSSNISTKEDEHVIATEQLARAVENVIVEEINKIDAIRKTDSQSNQAVACNTMQTVCTSTSFPNKPWSTPPAPKKYQTKSTSPTRRSAQNYHSKMQASRPFSNTDKPTNIHNEHLNNKLNKLPTTSPKRPKSQPSSNIPRAKPIKPHPSPLPPPPPPQSVEVDEVRFASNIYNTDSNFDDNLKNLNIEANSGKTNLSEIQNIQDQPPPEPHVPSELNLPIHMIAKPHSFGQLDYVKIKHELLHGYYESKQKILQALRWRLTRTDTKVRDHNLVCYITHDLLHIGTGSDFFGQYFKQSKNCEQLRLQEEASRFINTLASMSMGREYLEKCPNLIQILLPVLTNINSECGNFESLTRQFVMATIQKLSLCGRIRKLLINEGIVEWLIKYILINHELMTDYEAEYSVALFSNLCIHKQMRELCEIMSNETAQLLNVLVYTPHKCCLPYLSGILGSLLTNNLINKKAADLNIQAKLKYLAQIADDDETRQQLEFIIQLHESSSQNKCIYDVVEEPQVYSDYIECELGMNEPNYANPVGEKFLEHYWATYPSLEKHVHVVKRSCSYGVNKGQSDILEMGNGNNKGETSEVVSHLATSKQMSKIEIFKDMFNQVPSPSPPLTTLCRLNYYNLNRPISIPVKYSSVAKNKYSCECYDEIKNILSEDTKPPRNLQNSGRKPNNVVYGPLISPNNKCSTLSIYPCGLKQCCGVKS